MSCPQSGNRKSLFFAKNAMGLVARLAKHRWGQDRSSLKRRDVLAPALSHRTRKNGAPKPSYRSLIKGGPPVIIKLYAQFKSGGQECPPYTFGVQ